MEQRITSIVLYNKINIQKTKMPLRITSWKHLLNALLECLMKTTEIMHISKSIYMSSSLSQKPTFENKKKEDSEKGDENETGLNKRWSQKAFLRNTTMKNISYQNS